MATAADNPQPFSILVVEDDREALELLCTTLRRKYPGVRLATAENGAAGLKKFQQDPSDIVVTDINMPVMDGIRMTARIREQDPEAVVIFLTAHSETHYLLEAIELGVSQYVLKPIDVRRLCAAITKIREVLRLRRQVGELNVSLAARARELEAANRDLETFSYSVSHDLRNPLAAISGYLELALDSCPERQSQPCREYLAEARQIIGQMNIFIDALLNLAKFDRAQLNRQVVDLSALAQEAVRTLQVAEPDRRVACHIAQGITAWGDPVLLGGALANLLGNAWKFTGHCAKPVIEFGCRERAGQRVYFVRDNGVGFVPDQADKLFTPFLRLHLDDDFQGSGLGLATVKRIIQRHGGRIWAEGRVADGATFFFTLGEPGTSTGKPVVPGCP